MFQMTSAFATYVPVLIPSLVITVSAEISIPMTTPVSTFVQPTSSGNRYTMAFYVPSAHQADVPIGGPDVAVESRRQLTIFTRLDPRGIFFIVSKIFVYHIHFKVQLLVVNYLYG